MTPPDVTQQVADEAMALAAERRDRTEVVSVLVVTPDQATALQVAPALALRLYPGQRFGQPVHSEWMAHPGDGLLPGWEVLVEVLP
jgi:hypothetical protein